ncbi:HAD family hydrolase [Arcobacter ellisii]|uniref:phosphoglycolate phosphatase n=1 Tax=Arcobacter ellisii TaxID=913109 RepID=A0A347U9F6_9BACT|nr:HAD family hydrolase [Arcobacter ellisii]AXX95484.1 beta-phosphoglucomutase-like HAD superfamily hydrolase [Arcobacter ellisii]RXI29869.1 HAD family hydrolase [Arcobacter ellisii]
MKKYILFDNDGVLVHTEPLYFKANIQALKKFFDVELEFEEYMKIMSEGTTVWQKALDKGFSFAEVEIARNKRNEYYQNFLKTENILIDGVKDVLKELSKDYKMGIVTTSRRVDFEIIHKNLGIVDFMDFVLCEEDYNFAKPHPEPYLKGLELFKAKKQEAIVVEDSTRGLTAAHKAGIECVIVKNEFTLTQDFSKASYFIETLKELKTILN